MIINIFCMMVSSFFCFVFNFPECFVLKVQCGNTENFVKLKRKATWFGQPVFFFIDFILYIFIEFCFCLCAMITMTVQFQSITNDIVLLVSIRTYRGVGGRCNVA